MPYRLIKKKTGQQYPPISGCAGKKLLRHLKSDPSRYMRKVYHTIREIGITAT